MLNIDTTHVMFSIKSKSPAILNSDMLLTVLDVERYTMGMIMALCRSIIIFRHIDRSMCMGSAIGSCFIKWLDAVKELHPSVTVVVINVQSIIPMARNGRSSPIGVLNILPNTSPMLPIIIPMLMVSQNGPIFDLL